ncbi:hypothetical protein HanIR_Chr04g0182561 [Helianthus annuus]|nr:hypothetical protein HanIR_Chr04g0182561 [Helianthus annuus]
MWVGQKGITGRRNSHCQWWSLNKSFAGAESYGTKKIFFLSLCFGLYVGSGQTIITPTKTT